MILKACSRNVTTIRNLPKAGKYLIHELDIWEERERRKGDVGKGNIRFNGIHHVFENIFEFSRILLDLIKRTGIRRLRGIGWLDPCVLIWLIHIGKLSTLLLTEHGSQRKITWLNTVMTKRDDCSTQ